MLRTRTSDLRKQGLVTVIATADRLSSRDGACPPAANPAIGAHPVMIGRSVSRQRLPNALYDIDQTDRGRRVRIDI